MAKNVAGYDLGRLLAGSAGTLGFLTELTLRVASLPDSCSLVQGRGSLERIASAASELLGSTVEPAFVAATPINGPSAAKGQVPGGRTAWRLAVGLEGFGETVEARTERVLCLLSRAGLEEEAPVGYEVHEGPFAEAQERLGRSVFLLRADLPMDRVARFVEAAAGAVRMEGLFADFGCGRVRAGISDISGEAWERMCGLAEGLEGHILLEKAPDPFRRAHEVYGRPRGDWKLMHRIKRALDPKRIFAPGRLPGRG